jgi:hypothetical protein
MSFSKVISGKNSAVLAIALFGVLGLGAKGCDRAVVGDDGQCKNCTSGEGGESSGSGGDDAGGTGGTTGHAGSASAGRGGSGSAGKSGGAGTTGHAGTGSGTATCGGLAGGACPDGQFCDFPPDAICGAADGTGVCRDIPEVCTEEYAPVCGCDDQTYGNACFAAAAGVSIVSDGPCESEGTVCGGFQGEQCAEDEYCDYPPESYCGRADGPGVCQPKPEACDLIYAPVCGCDGQTYGNACAAALAGVSVETDGECEGEPNGDVCGGLKGTACPKGSFCSYPVEAMCGAADQTGTCEVMPEICTDQYDPVCGCDDKTYGNACSAAGAGISVQHTGECETEPGEICGGFTAIQCPGDLFCNFPIETNCGSGDQNGVCAAKPEVCGAVHDPVCGCDGKTYTNACAAQGAGVSIMADGECASD